MAAGDITYSHVGGMGGESAFASGTVSADADTAVNVLCGFVPSRIVLHYKDTGAVTNDEIYEWVEGMTAAQYWKTQMSDGIVTLETSGGPVVYGDTTDDTFTEGSAPDYEDSATGHGFTIPAGLQATDEDVIYWQAWR